MKITLEQLKKLLATYRLKALQIHPIDNGYIVDTNKGRKAVTVWENGELLKWSNRWREEVAIQGGTGVERFQTNINKKKYIRYQGKYFVLSSFPEGKNPDLNNDEECCKTGEIFAKYHLALDRIDQGSLSLVSHTFVDDQLFIDATNLIKEQMKIIESKQQTSFIDELIYINLPLIYKRFCRAFQLWEVIKGSIAFFPLSTGSYRLEQITKNEDGWYISGGYNQALAPIHQDTVQLMRNIYESSEWSLKAVGNFLKGYATSRNWSRDEQTFILMQLAVPIEVWTNLMAYFKQDYITEELSTAIIESTKRQKYWDELATFLARYMDQRNKESA